MIPAVPEYITDLVPYQPGKPIEELERELGISGSIKLASNENPVGPSPAVVEAILQNTQNINRYPDGGCHYLRSALAKTLGVESDGIIIGNGSNEIIELALRAFVRPGEDTLFSQGAFLVYDLSSRVIGAGTIRVPMVDFTHDLKAMARAITPATRIVFITNPNNPTGTMVTSSAANDFLKSVPAGVLVVFDEAYCEYVSRKDYPDSLVLLREYDNLLVIRTFSKAYGLAGLRIGYGLAHPNIVEILNKVRQPFNVNFLAQVAALAALKDRDHLSRVISLCTSERKRMVTALSEMGCPSVPSETNFILVRVGQKSTAIYNALLAKGVIVRAMQAYGFTEYIRVTVGLPQENDRFIKELAELVKKRTSNKGGEK